VQFDTTDAGAVADDYQGGYSRHPKQGNNAGSRFMNYYSLGNSLLMLSFMSTG
jgi:hypothetical protein